VLYQLSTRSNSRLKKKILAVSLASCDIPLEYQGEFFSNDIQHYDRITIESDEISMEDTSGETDKHVTYTCQDVIGTSTEPQRSITLQLEIE
jgi:hypothetical protein